MNKEEADALESSIAGWEKRAMAESVKEVDAVPRCALCDLHSRNIEDSCNNCVVVLKGGYHCSQTPYMMVHYAYNSWNNDKSNAEFGIIYRAAALAEFNFLKGLRDA